jgi:hypothetical protein
MPGCISFNNLNRLIWLVPDVVQVQRGSRQDAKAMEDAVVEAVTG